MSKVSGEAARLIEALETLPCEIELPDSWAEKKLAPGTIIDGDHDRRRYPRLACRTSAALCPKRSLPAIPRNETWVRIMLRNVSRCGAGFWHSEQLFPEEECLLVFPNKIQRVFKVMRCRRLGPKCYDIGGEFTDEAGDLLPDQLQQARGE